MDSIDFKETILEAYTFLSFSIPLPLLPVNDWVHHGVKEGEQLGDLGEVVENYTNIKLKKIYRNTLICI